MHARCCEEIVKLQGGVLLSNVPASNEHNLIVDFRGYENVPAIVEVRMVPDSAPGAGNLFTFTQLWDGAKARNGNLTIVRTSTEIATCFNNGFDVGFAVEFPGGIGRGFGIHNNTTVTFTDVFVSVKRLIIVNMDEKEVEAGR